MPVSPMTVDAPSTTQPYADTLTPNSTPLTSATSDMPVIAPAIPATATPVDKPAEQENVTDTSAKVEGEENGAPTEKPGEDGDKTSPQQRAAFARERNRRQAAEQRATALESKVDQLIEVVSKLTPREQPKEDPRPARTAFDDPNAYDRALEDWAGRRAKDTALAEAKAEQQKQDQTRRFEAVRDTFNERKATFEADHPDFEDVVYQDDVKISPPMSQAILEAEDGPAIAYYLGQNPEVAERLSKLSPAQAVYEIGKISTRISNPPKPKPEPIRPLAARNSAGPKDPSEMSMDEYAVYRKSKAH